MVAPLVIAAIGLAKQKADQTQANVENDIQAWMAYERARQRHEYDVQAGIDARRAAKAGDSGYMQAAFGHGGAMDGPRYNAPQFVGDNGAGMRLAQGLMAQKEADAYESDFAKSLQAQQQQPTAAAVPTPRADPHPISEWVGPDQDEWSSFGSWG